MLTLAVGLFVFLAVPIYAGKTNIVFFHIICRRNYLATSELGHSMSIQHKGNLILTDLEKQGSHTSVYYATHSPIVNFSFICCMASDHYKKLLNQPEL